MRLQIEIERVRLVGRVSECAGGVHRKREKGAGESSSSAARARKQKLVDRLRASSASPLQLLHRSRSLEEDCTLLA